MAGYTPRGLDERHEQDMRHLIRDTRTLGMRIADFFRNPTAVAITLVVAAVGTFFLPAIADLLLLFGVGSFIYTINQHSTLPFRLPKRSGLKDYNDPKSGSNKPQMARGIYFFGNQVQTDLELWFANEDMRTHVLIFGSTGSGKTEALVSIAYNSLLQASGFIYVDGKGDNSLFSKVFSMTRYMGREDDMLLINFMTGARDILGPQKTRLSNTMNPFAMGSSSMLSQLVISLMESGSSSSDGDMWKGRAIAFVEALMRILVAMRDMGYILLDAHTIRRYFELSRIEAIVCDKVFVRDNQEAISLENVSDFILDPINSYADTLPGFNRAKKGKQANQTYEQHGFITMQLTRVFGSLADTYGHIMRHKLAEVDLKDVVLNRRILTVLLPALEKSPDELSNLGKVIIATLKAMMAAGLGEQVEGEYHDLVQRKPTNSPTPFLCILDEYGYYAVQGFAVVPAQARSLGFSVVFAGQDLPALQKASKEEAATIGANCNIKICMKLEDPLETWDFFSKTAGESYVTHVSGFQADAKGLTNNYMDTKSAQLEKRARIDLLDLKEQREGEGHIFFKSRVIRYRSFYANPPAVQRMRLNQHLKVDVPPDTDMYRLAKGLEEFEQLTRRGEFFVDPPDANADIEKLARLMQENAEQTPIERGIAALIAYREQAEPVQPIEEAPELPAGELDIFTPLRAPDDLKALAIASDINSFAQPLLGRAQTAEQLQYVGRLMMQPENQATEIANDLARDMANATFYPPEIHDKPTGVELADSIEGLIREIDLKRQQAGSDEDLF